MGVKLVVENLSLPSPGHTELRHLTLSSSVVFEMVEHIMVKYMNSILSTSSSSPGQGGGSSWLQDLHQAEDQGACIWPCTHGNTALLITRVTPAGWGALGEWEMKFSLVKLLLFTLRSPGWRSFQRCPFSRQEKMGAAIQHYF